MKNIRAGDLLYYFNGLRPSYSYVFQASDDYLIRTSMDPPKEAIKTSNSPPSWSVILTIFREEEL